MNPEALFPELENDEYNFPTLVDWQNLPPNPYIPTPRQQPIQIQPGTYMHPVPPQVKLEPHQRTPTLSNIPATQTNPQNEVEEATYNLQNILDGALYKPSSSKPSVNKTGPKPKTQRQSATTSQRNDSFQQNLQKRFSVTVAKDDARDIVEYDFPSPVAPDLTSNQFENLTQAFSMISDIIDYGSTEDRSKFTYFLKRSMIRQYERVMDPIHRASQEVSK